MCILIHKFNCVDYLWCLYTAYTAFEHDCLFNAYTQLRLTCALASQSLCWFALSLQNPIKETDPVGPNNPYGQTKLMLEQILQDLFKADNTWRISILRYFNPVGNHPSGRIGESPDYPANLAPFIQQVAVGRRPILSVFGNDWNTVDGTGAQNKHSRWWLACMFSPCIFCPACSRRS